MQAEYLSSEYIRPEIDVVELASQFKAELKERAEEFEQQGFVSQDITDRLAALGLYRLCNPIAAGGLGRPPIDYARLVEALASADASAGWVVFIGITSAISATNIDPAALKDMMSDPLAITAGVFAPMGKAIATTKDGVPGFRLTGQWQWGSGSRNAKFISAGGFVVDENGDKVKLENGVPDQRSFFLPIEDVTLLDTWHVMGLKGSGSTDYRVDDVFVPETMTFSAFKRTAPRDPIHSFPSFAFLGIGIGAVALGIARASLDEFVTLAKQKTPQGSSKPLALKPVTQQRVAEAEAKLRAAKLFFHDAINTAWQIATETGKPTVDARRDIRLATTHAVKSAAQVVDTVYTLAGGSSVYLKSPIQRHFRDVHVATQHMMVNDATLELVGRLLLGVETNVAQL